MHEVYVSINLEIDGLIPGPPQRSVSVWRRICLTKRLLPPYTANLETLSGAVGDPKTMARWQAHPEAWRATRRNVQPPHTAMHQYLQWLKTLLGKPVFVAHPAAFDFMFVYWYLIHFTGESPLSHSALDIKTYAMALLKTPYRTSTKKHMPCARFDQLLRKHYALDDTIEQGALLCKVLAANGAR